MSIPQSLPHIDLTEALQRFGGNWKVFRQLIHQFIKVHEGVPQEAKSHFHEGKIHELGKLAHRIKGAAGNLSAVALKNNAQRLEKTVKEGKVDDIEEILSDIAQNFEDLKALAKSI